MSKLAKLDQIEGLEFVDDLDSPLLGGVINNETVLTFAYAGAAIAAVLYVPMGLVTAAGLVWLGYKDVQATIKADEGGKSRANSANPSVKNRTTKQLPALDGLNASGVQSPETSSDSRQDWESVFNRIVDQAEFPSIFIYGRQGTGKTTLVNYLLSLIGNEKVVLDPHYRYGAWKGCQVIGKGQNYRAIDEYITDCLEDIQSRYGMYATVPNYEPKTITIVCEELTNWAEHISKGKEFTKASLSDFRKAGYQAINVAHSDTNTARGGADGTRKMRDNGEVKIQLLAKGKALVSIPDEETFELKFPDLSALSDQSDLEAQRQKLEGLLEEDSAGSYPAEEELGLDVDDGLKANAMAFADIAKEHLFSKKISKVTLARLLADNYQAKRAFHADSRQLDIRDKGRDTAKTLALTAAKLGYLKVEERGDSVNIFKPEPKLFS